MNEEMFIKCTLEQLQSYLDRRENSYWGRAEDVNKGLCQCIQQGDLKKVELLINYSKIDINQCDLESGQTPIFLAIKNANAIKRLEILRSLFGKGIKVNFVNKKDQTPLVAACETGNTTLVQFLINHGADVNLKNSKGQTALHVASKLNFFRNVVVTLIERGAEMSVDKKNRNPLKTSALKLNDLIFNLMIEKGMHLYIGNPANYDHMLERVNNADLLGAMVICNFSDHKKAYEIWKDSLKTRQEVISELKTLDRYDLLPLFTKCIHPIVEAYDYNIEISTVEELEQIKDDVLAMYEQGLLIAERLVSSKKLIKYLINFCQKCYVNKRYQKALRLIVHGVEQIDKEGQLFIHMGALCRIQGCLGSYLVKKHSLAEYWDIFIHFISIAIIKINDNLRYVNFFRAEISSCVGCMVVLLNSIVKEKNLLTDRMMQSVQEVGEQMARLILYDNRTVLHLVCEIFKKNPHYEIFLTDAIEFLIECGAKANAKDKSQNTPLQVLYGLDKNPKMKEVPPNNFGSIRRTDPYALTPFMDLDLLIRKHNKEDEENSKIMIMVDSFMQNIAESADSSLLYIKKMWA